MEYIKIGKILNTRGIKGELKIKPLTDFQNDRYKSGNTIYIFHENEYLLFEVKKYRPYKNLDLLTLKNNEDINLVEKYKGSYIFVSSDSETTLLEGEYHLSELIDLEVYQAKRLVGHISDIKTYPQGDYVEILTIDSAKKLVPFRDEFVIDVNLDKAYIEIIEMEGLLWE